MLYCAPMTMTRTEGAYHARVACRLLICTFDN
jgi:hypothetical protein